MKTETINLSKLHLNTGQVQGLPKNPRFIRSERFELLKKSIEDDPEMMQLREIIAYDNHGELVIIMGNMRYRAMKELGMKSAPVKVLPEDTPVEKLKAYTIKDNVSFGQDDFDLLANDWDVADLEDWGVELPVDQEPSDEQDEGTEDYDQEENGYKISYELVFDDEQEQDKFFELLKYVKDKLPEVETISQRLIAALTQWKERDNG